SKTEEARKIVLLQMADIAWPGSQHPDPTWTAMWQAEICRAGNKMRALNYRLVHSIGGSVFAGG
ncbi:unnamed protein product, partial [Sphenostylis stenocarpa]